MRVQLEKFNWNEMKLKVFNWIKQNHTIIKKHAKCEVQCDSRNLCSDRRCESKQLTLKHHWFTRSCSTAMYSGREVTVHTACTESIQHSCTMCIHAALCIIAWRVSHYAPVITLTVYCSTFSERYCPVGWKEKYYCIRSISMANKEEKASKAFLWSAAGNL